MPRIFDRRGWKAADFRKWGEGRLTLRDPESPTWPAGGERTTDGQVATRWVVNHYLPLFREKARRRHLKIGPLPRQLGAAADQWLDARLRTMAYNTWKGNQTAINHLKERLGKEFSTDRLTTATLQAFFDELHGEGYAENSLRNCREAISQFLGWLGQAGRNAALAVKLPAVIHEEVATWEPEQLEKLRAAADALDQERTDFQRHRLAVELALACGARRHELFALQWSQIRRAGDDPPRGTIRITHQLFATRRELAPLKGKTAGTAVILPSWWEHHQEGAKGLILADAHGELVNPNLLQRLGARLLDRAELHAPGVGWHIFRHTYARDFIEMGGRFEELQKSLRHKSITTTERLYGHFHEDIAAELAIRRIYRLEPLRAVR